MRIVELGDGENGDSGSEIVSVRAKRALVWAGARFLFYPTLLYNVVRSKMETEFRWWDEVHPFILLGAVPFPNDVPRLQQLGVRAVITLNEPYETLVPSSLYKEHGIDHLVIPTRDYLFAPSLVDICRAVDFIDRNASQGRITYVHCKAGRGRSTTIVLCYLIEYRHMTPSAALEYVRLRRPRVLLAQAQWQAVQDFCRWKMDFPGIRSPRPIDSLSEDGVLITAADLEGYMVPEDSEELRITLYKDDRTKPAIVKHMPESSLEEDEVLITEVDLEGYETFINNCRNMTITVTETSKTLPVTTKLSFLFASLKSSTSRQLNGSIQEIQTC